MTNTYIKSGYWLQGARMTRPKKTISKELYSAIVEAERAANIAHNMCYREEYRAPFFLSIQLGKAQSYLMHNVVKYADRVDK